MGTKLRTGVGVVLLVGAGLFVVAVGSAAASEGEGVSSEISTTAASERVVTQEFVINAPVSEVWKRFTTAEGWMEWVAPVAEVDLRAGGTIRTHYGEGASIGDPGTNVLHIVNYVPERVLTLQAELAANWPEVMKEDADNLMNVIVFETIDGGRTRISSYGVGYRDTPAYDGLLEFFVPANEKLYLKLKKLLESGDSKQP